MLSSAARDRLVVVLVGARNPGNIGAAARAMRDFGFGDLRVVNEYAPPFEAAQLQDQPQQQATGQVEGGKAAVGAMQVLAAARRFERLEDAIADCTLVAGTTAVGQRGLTRPVLPLSEAAPQLLDALRGGQSGDQIEGGSPKIALLFGSEKTGLTNEQLSHCQLLLTIPMSAPEGERHLSMNLGQAVAVCLYELVRAGFEGARELPVVQQAPVTAASRERLTQLLVDAMAAIGYAQRFPANAREHVVRQLAQQLGGCEAEATTWMGFLRQVARGTARTRAAHNERDR
ncbi:MAG TPA: RNA methyltransferase [Acidobacteriaceae bacterium]